MKKPENLEACLTGTFLLLSTLLLTAFIIVGCSAPRPVTQLVEHVQKDTIYLSNVQYDSIYIYQEMNKDYHRGIPHPSSLNPHPSSLNPHPSSLNPQSSPDTLYIKDKSIEYRYKLLRDTVSIVQRDSIPYEVIVYKDSLTPNPSPLNLLFDRLCRICFYFLSGALFVLFARFVFRLKSVFKP